MISVWVTSREQKWVNFGERRRFDVVNSFAVSGLNADGGGTAHLDCGGACGFDFSIQVSPDRSVFNLVTVSAADAGENLSGVAIRRSTAGHIVKANLASAWQGTSLSFEEDLDDAEAVLATLKLNAKAQTKNATIVLHGTDGDATLTGITVSVLTLNPDGSGTVRLTVTFDGETFSFDSVIQVSPDRSMMSVVTVDPGGDDDLSAGVMIAY